MKKNLIMEDSQTTDSSFLAWLDEIGEYMNIPITADRNYSLFDNETFANYNETYNRIGMARTSPRPNFGPPCQLKLTPRLIVLIVCFTIIFTLSVIGNCLVIVTIAQNRWMRTVTNIFLQSLAISDLLLSVICMPPTLTAMLFQCFLWGQAMCKLISYLQPVSVAASAYTLVAIALERYNAICRPLHSRHWKTKSHAIKMIVAVWVISLICSSPALFIYNSVEIRPGQWNCREDWGDSMPDLSGFFYLFLLLVLFVVPLVLMIGLYSAVTYTLWMGIKLDSTPPANGEMSSPSDERSSVRFPGSSIRHRVATTKPIQALRRFGRSIRDRSTSNTSVILINRQSSSLLGSQKSPPSVGGGQKMTTSNSGCLAQESKSSSNLTGPDLRLLGGGLRSTHSAKNLEAKKRVIIMLFVIVAEFLICWAPLYAYIALFHLGYLHWDVFDLYLNTFLVVLSYISSCSNPITYCFLNLKFRQAFLLAFGCRFLVKEAPLLYQNTLIAHHRQTNIHSQAGGGPRRLIPSATTAATNGTKQETIEKDQLQPLSNHPPLQEQLSQPQRAIDSLVVQCHEPVNTTSSFAIPLLQLRTPSCRQQSTDAAGVSKINPQYQIYDTSDDDEDELIVSESMEKLANGNRSGGVSPSVTMPIGNGNTNFPNKNKLNGRHSTPSPSPVQEKLTSV